MGIVTWGTAKGTKSIALSKRTKRGDKISISHLVIIEIQNLGENEMCSHSQHLGQTSKVKKIKKSNRGGDTCKPTDLSAKIQEGGIHKNKKVGSGGTFFGIYREFGGAL